MKSIFSHIKHAILYIIALFLLILTVQTVFAQQLYENKFAVRDFDDSRTENFTFNSKKTKILAPDNCISAQYLFNIMRQDGIITDSVINRMNYPQTQVKQSLIFTPVSVRKFKKDGYCLDIRPDRITVEANTESGYIYAIQKLMQVFEYNFAFSSFNKTDTNEKIFQTTVNCIKIEDYTDVQERKVGFYLTKNNLDKDLIKQYLNLFVFNRMNTVYMYLSEEISEKINSDFLKEIFSYSELLQIDLIPVKHDSDYTEIFSDIYIFTPDNIEDFTKYSLLLWLNETEYDPQYYNLYWLQMEKIYKAKLSFYKK